MTSAADSVVAGFRAGRRRHGRPWRVWDDTQVNDGATWCAQSSCGRRAAVRAWSISALRRAAGQHTVATNNAESLPTVATLNEHTWPRRLSTTTTWLSNVARASKVRTAVAPAEAAGCRCGERFENIRRFVTLRGLFTSFLPFSRRSCRLVSPAPCQPLHGAAFNVVPELCPGPVRGRFPTATSSFGSWYRFSRLINRPAARKESATAMVSMCSIVTAT